MKKENNLTPFHYLILIAAYITDVYLVLFRRDLFSDAIYILLMIVVIVPPLVLLFFLTVMLYKKLEKKFIRDQEGAARKKRLLKAAIALVFAAAIGSGFAIYHQLTVTGPLQAADALLADEQFDEAIERYRDFERTRDADCGEQLGNAYAGKIRELLDRGNTEEAVEILRGRMADYASLRRQVPEMLNGNEELYQAFFAPNGRIAMGAYYPDSKSGTLTNWYVLEVKDGSMLLISELSDGWISSSMAPLQRSEGSKGTSGWENSALRAALNKGEKSLYNRKFTDAERAAIRLTTLENTVHENNEVTRGNDTQDYIFVLSRDEVERYRDEVPPSPDSRFGGWYGYGDWWTRTAANLEEVQDNYFSSVKECSGYMLKTGDTSWKKGDFIANSADSKKVHVYPAMWVSIDLLLKAWAE